METENLIAQTLVLPFVLASSVLFLLGAWFCYSVIFPLAFRFFAAITAPNPVRPAVRP